MIFLEAGDSQTAFSGTEVVVAAVVIIVFCALFVKIIGE